MLLKTCHDETASLHNRQPPKPYAMETSQRSLLIVCAISAYYLQYVSCQNLTTTKTTSSAATAISNCLDGYRETVTEDGTTFCAPCSRCPFGYGVKSVCSKSRDTVCEACLDGVSYSSSESALEKCRSCQSCPYQQTSSCTTVRDTQCSANICNTGFYYDEIMLACNPCGYCDPQLPTPVISQCMTEGGMPADWSCATKTTTTTTTVGAKTEPHSAPTQSSTEGEEVVTTPKPKVVVRLESSENKKAEHKGNNPVLLLTNRIDEDDKPQLQISKGNVDFVLLALLVSLVVLVLATSVYLVVLYINKKRARKLVVLLQPEIYDNFSDTTHLV